MSVSSLHSVDLEEEGRVMANVGGTVMEGVHSPLLEQLLERVTSLTAHKDQRLNNLTTSVTSAMDQRFTNLSSTVAQQLGSMQRQFNDGLEDLAQRQMDTISRWNGHYIVKAE